MSNLLEKASIVTTPTAYDNGKILSVKPNKTFGSNLIDYDNITYGSGSWSLVNDKWVFDDATSGYLFVDNLDVEVGQKYQVTVNISISSGDANFRISSGNSQTLLFNYTDFADGETTFETTVTGVDGTLERLFAPTSLTDNPFTLNSISVNKITEADFDFTRNSSATRVNSQGLIEDVQILSSNLVSNGDFSQEGSELIINGDFSNGVNNWAQGSEVSSFTVTNGIATIQGNASSFNTRISQSISVTIGKTYKITGEIKSNDAGYYRVRLFNGSYLDITNGNNSEFQTFTYYHNATTSTAILYLSSYYSNGSADFSIDNVSVKEVGQDWTLGTGWSIGDSKAISDATQGYISQTNVGAAGVTATYKVQWTQNITAGARLRFFARNYNDSGNETILSGSTTGEGSFGLNGNSVGSGTFTAFVSSTNGYSFKILAEAGVEADISNISAIEITEDTNLPRINYEGFSYQDAFGSELVVNGGFDTDISGWVKGSGNTNPISWDSGKMKVTNDVALLNSARQTIVTEIGKTYKVSADVDSTNGVNPRLATSNPTTAIIGTSGTIETLSYTFVATSTFSEINLYNWQNTLGAYNLWDNVSVKEYLGQEVVPDSGVGSWLFEPQSTNLMPYSEDFTADPNFVTSVPIGLFESGYLAPDGTLTATRINGITGSYAAIQGLGSLDIRSVYVKSGNGQTGNVRFLDRYDDVGNLFEVTNEWKRVEHIGTDAWFYIFDARGNDTTLDDIMIWGLQQEDLTYATSYIPTNGSIKTRLQDAAFGAGSSDLINSTEGVLYFEGSALTDTDTTNPNRGISISSGSTNNTIFIYYQAALNTLACILISNGTTQFSHSTSLFDVDDYLKIALKYKQNDFALWVNGTEIATDTSGNAPIGLNELAFDNGVGNDKFYGKAKCVAVFKEALTDEELTCLTTI